MVKDKETVLAIWVRMGVLTRTKIYFDQLISSDDIETRITSVIRLFDHF